MTDALKKVKEMFAQEPPIVPREDAKRVAIEQAMEAYDKNLSPAHQGTGIADRLRNTAQAVFQTIIGRRPMRHSSILAGGVSLGVLTLAVLSATYIQTDIGIVGSGERTSPTPILPTQETPVVKAPVTEPKSISPSATPAPMLDAARQQQASETQTKQPADKRSAKMRRERDALAQKSDDAKVGQLMAEAESRGLVQTAPAPVARKLSRQNFAVAPQPAAPSVAMRSVGSGRRIGGGAVSPDPAHKRYYEDQGRDQFESVAPNPIKIASQEPVSTFSADVDTASYSFVRASLNNNVLPQKDAVRIEEMINYFPYGYTPPADRKVPFSTSVTVTPSPWSPDRKLVHIGIAGFELTPAEKPHSNLVFLLDTSGSMNAPNKLPLVINSMKLLLGSLKPDDTVAIVTYAGSAGTALEPTKVKEKAKILRALDSLTSRGSTAGAEGIRQAYALAQQAFDKKGVNRVILATDGDFNVGITNREELKSFVERKRESGITLSVLGFGRGNYNDALMQTLAQNGNGNAAYIDTLSEARKVLVDEASSTLFTIAKDVKMQFEFNPRTVAEYRLIGYETRMLKREDFNNDKVDAGDIGAGHRVTALYEITPAGSAKRLVDDLRYQAAKPLPASSGKDQEYGFLKIRYKLPNESSSKLITQPVGPKAEKPNLAAASADTRFATSVAAFGQILKGGRHTGSFGYDDVIALAQGAKGTDQYGYRAEFINLVRLAKTASSLQPLPPR